MAIARLMFDSLISSACTCTETGCRPGVEPDGSPGDFSLGIEGHYVRPWSLNLLFCRKGVGLVVSVVVPLMLAVLPYARGRGLDSRSRLLFIV
jgi:hypothetical protein